MAKCIMANDSAWLSMATNYSKLTKMNGQSVLIKWQLQSSQQNVHFVIH